MGIIEKGLPKGLPSDRSKAINEDGKIINAITGLTEEQQIAANLAEKEKQSNNQDLYGAYKAAQNALRSFENTNPGAYFSWSVEDEDGNSKFDRSESIAKEIVTGSTKAQTGDWIWIWFFLLFLFLCLGTSGTDRGGNGNLN